MLNRQRRKRLQPQSVGADKGYHTQYFVSELRQKYIAPHVACMRSRSAQGLDMRTLGSPAYRAGKIGRKRIEQFFGWG